MRLPLALAALSFTLAAAAPVAAQGAPASPPAPAAAPAPYAPPPVQQPYLAPYGAWSPLPPVPATERRSQGMVIAGILLFAAGGVASTVGAGIVTASVVGRCDEALTEDDNEPPPSPPSSGAAHRERLGTSRQAINSCNGVSAAGVSLVVGGLFSALVGVPLYLVGNTRILARPESFALLPEVRPGPRGADLRWTF